MINYVNNAFDKVLKPCDAQQFSILVNSLETERLILGHRGGDQRCKPKLPAFTYMGALDKDKYKTYLRDCEEKGVKPLGSRRAEFMRPTGLFMLDFDHVGKQAGSPLRDGVILSNANLQVAGPKGKSKDLAECNGEILHSVQNDRDAAIDSPVKLWEYIVSKLSGYPLRTSCSSPLKRDSAESAEQSNQKELSPFKGDERNGAIANGAEGVCLAHITPSGDGLRVVVKRPKGLTIEQAQYEWCQTMEFDKVGIKIDAVCKDISRLSFAPMQKEILYFNPSLLFAELPEAGEYPDGSLWGGDSLRDGVILSETKDLSESPAQSRSEILRVAQKRSSPPIGSKGNDMQEGVTEYPTEYNGVAYSEVIKRLEEQLGGRPEHGARNTFIFTMACNLRYICNDDPAWIASILPTYGEDPQKHRSTVQSAVNRPMSRNMPDPLARALRICNAAKEANCQLSVVNCQLPPELPATLPEPIELLTSRTPERMKSAVAMAVFPPLGAHLCGTRFSYWDGRDYEPTFMNVLVAELSTGKSAVNTPIQYIIADIKERDTLHRSKMQSWRDACMGAASTKDKPERPKGLSVQCLSPDMTNAAFVQRLADAEGHFLYTLMDEIELLNALKTNTQGGTVSAVLRLAFDCGDYGQERVAANAIDAQVQVRWNWNASTTVQRVRKFFAHNIADGTLSRVSFATIIKEKGTYGRNRPTFGSYGEDFARELQPYVDALNTCHGDIHCPEASAWALALCDELADFAEEMEDEVYAQISHRAVLMGFFRASLLYVMNGMQWSQQIADFAAWTVKYDLWCKMRFFSDMLHADLAGEEKALQRGPRGLLEMLPKEFTRQQVVDLRESLGMSSKVSNILKQWKHRGQVDFDDCRGVYIKC